MMIDEEQSKHPYLSTQTLRPVAATMRMYLRKLYQEHRLAPLMDRLRHSELN